MNFSKLKQFFETHSPSCIGEFVQARSDLPGVELDGHGEELESIISISCGCGCKVAKVQGYYWNNPDFNNIEVSLSPLVYVCSSCSNNKLIFDSDQHGYDPVIGSGSCSARAEGKQSFLRCTKCGGDTFTLTTRFSYPDDLFEDPDDSFIGREQDAFSWFSLHGQCHKCSTIVELADFECA